MDAGQRLRSLRERLGLSFRDVETVSLQVATKYGNNGFSIPRSRLFEIETKGVVPSVYRFYSLSAAYRRDMRELMGWYGIDVNSLTTDSSSLDRPYSHLTTESQFITAATVPLELDPSFDSLKTAPIGPMIKRWGVVPLAYLNQFTNPRYTYAYIGSRDFTMYPMVPPGSFVQIDESKDKVVDGDWRSEYERPIYFVETREGYLCGWCSLRQGRLTLQPHPLSPEPVRMFRYPQEAEVIGEVIGVALHRRDVRPPLPPA